MFYKYPKTPEVPFSHSYGVRVMDLRGPYTSFQRRMNPLAEFGQFDRNWRSQYLHDTLLTPKDASVHYLDVIYHPECYKARFNIFRRIYRVMKGKLTIFNIDEHI